MTSLILAIQSALLGLIGPVPINSSGCPLANATQFDVSGWSVNISLTDHKAMNASDDCQAVISIFHEGCLTRDDLNLLKQGASYLLGGQNIEFSVNASESFWPDMRAQRKTPKRLEKMRQICGHPIAIIMNLPLSSALAHEGLKKPGEMRRKLQQEYEDDGGSDSGSSFGMHSSNDAYDSDSSFGTHHGSDAYDHDDSGHRGHSDSYDGDSSSHDWHMSDSYDSDSSSRRGHTNSDAYEEEGEWFGRHSGGAYDGDDNFGSGSGSRSRSSSGSSLPTYYSSSSYYLPSRSSYSSFTTIINFNSYRYQYPYYYFLPFYSVPYFSPFYGFYPTYYPVFIHVRHSGEIQASKPNWYLLIPLLAALLP